MSDFLQELADSEYEEREARRQRLNEAVEEYLLGRYKHYLDPAFKPPTVQQMCSRYKVTRGQMDHQIERLRQRLETEVADGTLGQDTQHSMGEWLGYLLNGAAVAQKERHGL